MGMSSLVHGRRNKDQDIIIYETLLLLTSHKQSWLFMTTYIKLKKVKVVNTEKDIFYSIKNKFKSVVTDPSAQHVLDTDTEPIKLISSQKR